MVGTQIVWSMGSQLIMSGIEKGTETLTFMASTGVSAYYGAGLRIVSSVGSRGKVPGGRSRGRSYLPTEAESILKCRRLIFILSYCARIQSCMPIGKDQLCDNRLVYERHDKLVGNTLQESFVRLSTAILSRLSGLLK